MYEHAGKIYSCITKLYELCNQLSMIINNVLETIRESLLAHRLSKKVAYVLYISLPEKISISGKHLNGYLYVSILKTLWFFKRLQYLFGNPEEIIVTCYTEILSPYFQSKAH